MAAMGSRPERDPAESRPLRFRSRSPPQRVLPSGRPIFHGLSEPLPAVERSVKPITIFSSKPLEPALPPPALGGSSPSNVEAKSVLIQEQSAEKAVRRFVHLMDLQTVAVEKLVLFDFHGVLDLNKNESCRVITDLVAEGVPVGILSYSRSQDTISNTLTYVQEICDRTEVMIPVVIAPRPLRKNCRHRNDWCKSNFLSWLLQDTGLQVCYLEDRGDIVQECRHLGSTNLRVILCTQDEGLAHAISDR